MIRFVLLAAALPLALPAFGADIGPRPLTVRRALDCPLVPVITGPGWRHMGEPGSFVARWDWGVPRACRIAVR